MKGVKRAAKFNNSQQHHHKDQKNKGIFDEVISFFAPQPPQARRRASIYKTGDALPSRKAMEKTVRSSDTSEALIRASATRDKGRFKLLAHTCATRNVAVFETVTDVGIPG
jgi:hypothetical protein